MWNKLDIGEGKPIILLHGIGMSHKAWKPIIPYLTQNRRVIAFDIPGFGESQELESPSIEAYMLALKEELKQLGIDYPVDIVGNSMGGWIALEAARIGLANSVVAISPGGLWLNRMPHLTKIFLIETRRVLKKNPNLFRKLIQYSFLRELLLAIPINIGSKNIPIDEAIDILNDFSHSPGFEGLLLNATRFKDGINISVPITIVFGTKDWVLSKKKCRIKDELPPHLNWIEQKGWGHVPMWRNPKEVAHLILENI